MIIPDISRTTYDLLLYIWIGVAVMTFISLLKITAPYGRHTTAKWGPMINNKLGWVIMEATVLFVLLFFVFASTEKQTAVTWTMIGLFCLHYINRTFIFPLRIHTRGKRMPLIITGSAVVFNLMNGFSLGYYFYAFADYSISWFSDIRFILGVILFFTGLAINWKADNVLIHLRKPNETHYVVPVSPLFRHISCPNLAGELLEWLGFALLCWNLPAVTFFIWTSANLIPRALSHHRWYKENFPDYPPGRKAIIPFVV